MNTAQGKATAAGVKKPVKKGAVALAQTMPTPNARRIVPLIDEATKQKYQKADEVKVKRVAKGKVRQLDAFLSSSIRQYAWSVHPSYKY